MCISPSTSKVVGRERDGIFIWALALILEREKEENRKRRKINDIETYIWTITRPHSLANKASPFFLFL